MSSTDEAPAPRTSTAHTIFVDGLCIPNPGLACWAWVAFDATGRSIASDAGTLGKATNNIAEYTALIQALTYATAQGWRGVHIRSDSQLVVQQTLGLWTVGAPALIELHDEALELGRAIGARIKWIPREKNTVADALSRQAWQDAQTRRAA